MYSMPLSGLDGVLYIMCVCMLAKSFHSCLTLCDPMDCSPPGSSVHGILQARMLEWVAISFSRGSSPSLCTALKEEEEQVQAEGEGVDAPLGPHMGEEQGAPQSSGGGGGGATDLLLGTLRQNS